MKLFYKKGEYVVDGTLAISTWFEDEEYGYLAPYGDVTVNLSGYGMRPEDGYIFIPTYKMTPEYFNQVCDDIVEEVVAPIRIGLGQGVYAKLRDDWESEVEMLES